MRYFFMFSLLISLQSIAGDTTKLYNPSADVKKDMAVTLAKAKAANKHVLLQIGGNWCIWCYRFDVFVKKDSALSKFVADNFVVYHLNYSAENKNLDYLKTLGFPQRFGFPVLVVLDGDGKRLHTQDSGLLEQGNMYNKDKVKSFFNNWSPSALAEKQYKE